MSNADRHEAWPDQAALPPAAAAAPLPGRLLHPAPPAPILPVRGRPAPPALLQQVPIHCTDIHT